MDSNDINSHDGENDNIQNTSTELGAKAVNETIVSNPILENPSMESSGSFEQNTPETTVDKKSKKKVLIIIGVVLVLIIAAIFGYIYINFTAVKFIDKKVDEFVSYVSSFESGYTTGDDIEVVGELLFNSSDGELEFLNDKTLMFDYGLSISKEILNIDLGMVDSSNSYLDINTYIDSERVYFDSEDLFSQTLYSELSSNWFDGIDIDNGIGTMIKTYAEAIGTIIKESSVTTKIEGLRARYTYVIDETNRDKLVAKINEIFEENESSSQYFVYIPEMTLEIVVKIPSGDIQYIEFISDDMSIVLEEVADNEYDLTINEVVFDVVVDEDENVTISYEDENVLIGVIYNKKNKTFEGNINLADIVVLEMSIANGNDNTKDIRLYINVIAEAIELNLVITDISSSEKSVTGSLDINLTDYQMNVGIEMVVKYGSDLVEEKTFSNLKNADELTSEEQMEITNNFYNILSDMGLDFGKTSFAEDGASVILAAKVYVLLNEADITCISISDLEALGLLSIGDEYNGKVDVIFDTTNGTYSYYLTLTDGVYMFVNYSGDDFYNNVEYYDSDILKYVDYFCEYTYGY